MKRKLIAIALSLSFIPALPQNTRAQTGVWEIPCVASGACAVIATYVVAGITYYTLRNKRTRRTWDIDGRNLQNHAQPQPRPGPRPEMRMEERPGYNEPGKVETHAVASPQLCRQMEQKFLMQGRKLKLHRIRRTTNPGLRYDCEFIGEDAVEGWFHDRRGGR